MSVSAVFEPSLSSTNNSDLGLGPLATDCNSSKTIPNGVNAFNASTTPPVKFDFIRELTLVAGASTIDMTAVDQGQITAEDWTGDKLQFIKCVANDANTDLVTIEPGAANGYELFGGASEQVSLGPGQILLMNFNDSNPDIGAVDKDIDFTSSDLDAKIEVHLVAG